MGHSKLILALDIGTSSCRTALFDASARRIEGSTTQEAYPLLTTADGGAELDPAILLKAVRNCITSTLIQVGSQKIDAVGVSCFWHSLIGTDAQGRAITTIYTWADSRCREDAQELRRKNKERIIHERTGCMLRTSFWPAKLKWLHRTRRKEFERVKRWMSPAEWLQLQFCGSVNCALGMATGTGLFNPTRLEWDAPLLKQCRMTDSILNPLSDNPSRLLLETVQAHPSLSEAVWYPAIGDGAASNLGSGATKPGLAAINVGTSAALRVMFSGSKAKAPFGLFCYRVDASRYLIGGAVSNAGNLRAWCLRELKLPQDPAELERQLAARPAPLHGLTVLPFWSADRAPAWREDLHGAIQGITLNTTALDLLQACNEAVHYRIARIAEMIVQHTRTSPKYIVSGGIQKSPEAIQRLTDVLGARVWPNEEPEASLRGAAVFALEKLGCKIPDNKACDPLVPRKKYTAMHARKQAEQQRLEDRL